jgi:WD40 repeat protein
VYDMVFTPDGQTLITGGGPGEAKQPGEIKFWRVSDGQLLNTVTHPYGVASLALSPDGTMLASGGTYCGAACSGQPDANEATIRLWRVSDGQLLREIVGPKVEVLSVAFSPDGQALASGEWDRAVKFWRPADGRLLLTYDEGIDQPIQEVKFSPDGRALGFSTAGGRLVMASNPFAGSSPNPTGTPGDVNGDGRVNIQDATLALQSAVNVTTLSAEQTSRADLNGDGRINIQDATAILLKAVGL